MFDDNENIDNQFNKIASSILKKKRLEKGYSLEEVVNKMNNTITRQALFKYENNEARIKIKTFKELCKALTLNPDEVIEEIAKKTYVTNYMINNDCILNNNDYISKKVERPSDEFLKEVNKIIDDTVNNYTLTKKNIRNNDNNVSETDIETTKKIIRNSKDFTEDGKKSLINMIDYFHSLAQNEKDKK